MEVPLGRYIITNAINKLYFPPSSAANMLINEHTPSIFGFTPKRKHLKRLGAY